MAMTTDNELTTEEQAEADKAAADQAAAKEAEAKAEQEAEEALTVGYQAVVTGEEPATQPADEDKDKDTGKDTDPDQTETDEAKAEAERAAAEEARRKEEEAKREEDPGWLTREQAEQMVNDTLEQYQAKVDERIRKLDGKYGELNSKLTERPAAAELTKESFKRLSEEYPDLAETLAEDMKEIALPGQGPQFDKDELTNEILEKSTATLEEKSQALTEMVSNLFLNYASPGWDEKVNSEEYDRFLESLPRPEREAIESSNDPVFVAQSVKRFDDWMEQEKAREEEERAKQKRLEESEPATKGGGTATQPSKPQIEADAFMDGFKSVHNNSL